MTLRSFSKGDRTILTEFESAIIHKFIKIKTRNFARTLVDSDICFQNMEKSKIRKNLGL